MNTYNIKLHLQINKAKFIEKEYPLFNEELLKSAIIKTCEISGFISSNEGLIIEYDNSDYSGLINLIHVRIELESENIAKSYQSNFIRDFEIWSKDIIDFYQDNYKLSVKAYKMQEGTSKIIYNNFSVQDWLYFRNAVLGLPDIFNINFTLLDLTDLYFEKCGIQYILEVI